MSWHTSYRAAQAFWAGSRVIAKGEGLQENDPIARAPHGAPSSIGGMTDERRPTGGRVAVEGEQQRLTPRLSPFLSV